MNQEKREQTLSPAFWKLLEGCGDQVLLTHLCVQSALPRDVPGGEQSREFPLDVVDHGVMDLVFLQYLCCLVTIHVLAVVS